MMIVIDTGGTLAIPVNGDTGALIAGLGQARKVQKNYSSHANGYKYKLESETPKPLDFTLVDDSCLSDANPVIEELTKKCSEADTRWYTEYQSHQATKEKLEELTKKVDAMTESITGVAAVKVA
jgi:hypothetical protein